MLEVVSERNLARYRQLRGFIFLVLLTVAMFQDEPRPGLSGRGLALSAGMTVGAAAWIAMMLRLGAPRWQPYSIGVCMAVGIALTLNRPGGFAACYTLAAVTVASASLSLRTAAMMTGTAAVCLAIAHAIVGSPLESTVIWVGALVLLLLIGVIRRERDARGAQDKLLAGEQAKAAMLAERARLAREIHDVLAHSLSALSLQLETAAALLERDRAPEAAVIVDRAGRLARDGLTETRRAVSALRGDPVPLPELVRELTTADHDFTLVGEPRVLSAETGLSLYRSAQEALTNVRKHAPGSDVEVRLEYLPGAVRLTVRNHGESGPPTTGLSSGYGLIGLRERAELAGGTFAAGPCEDGWLVDVKMPG